MYESPLAKVVRLAAVSVSSYQRRTSSGRVATVRQYQQGRAQGAGGMRLGTPYRATWGNVSTGDVVEFGSELWKVIPSSSYPGNKPSTSSGVNTASKNTTSSGTSTSSGTGTSTGGSSTGVGGVQTSTLYLQDLRHPSSFDKLTMPTTYVVTIVPVLP